jgi:hypothetical protein
MHLETTLNIYEHGLKRNRRTLLSSTRPDPKRFNAALSRELANAPSHFCLQDKVNIQHDTLIWKKVADNTFRLGNSSFMSLFPLLIYHVPWPISSCNLPLSLRLLRKQSCI